ncbi:MAG: hypothetical protein HS126_03720 [Anaerolineales bacterium]|nr:hypothetical protein [Anaerolineales bacterium]
MSALSATGKTAERSVSFEKLAGMMAVLAGIVHFLYAVFFVIISRSAPETGVLLSAIFLLGGGLLSITREMIWCDVLFRRKQSASHPLPNQS